MLSRLARAPRELSAGASSRATAAGGWTVAEWEHQLGRRPSTGVFDGAELDGLPAPVRRYFRAAITEGSPLASAASMRMRGHIRVGRWLPFRAREIIDPHVGFVWSARAAGLIAGSDHYLDGVGAMRWKVAGLFDVATGDGPDVSTSAAGRCGIEGILLPTALLPRTGVTWTAEDDEHVTAHHRVGSTPVDIGLTLDDAGLVRSVVMPRWGDPDGTGTWGWHPFGGEITGQRVFGGLTIPGAGRLGWHVGTDRWTSGEFFRYEITAFDFPGVAGGFDR